MKIAVISDVTFEPILKQISEHSDIKIDKYIYADQIVPELLNAKTILE